MALRKTTDLDSGFTAEYYRISTVVLNIDGKNLELRIELYKDKDSRINGKSTIKKMTYHLDVSDSFALNWLNQENNNIIKFAYIALKQKYFQDAEDV